MLTEETIRIMDVPGFLEKLCYVAIHGEMPRAWRYVPDFSSWEVAGQALEWLDCTLQRRRNEMGNNKDWAVMCDNDSIGIVSGVTGPLAIARAVALVGLYKRPEKMQEAWAQLGQQ